MGCLSFYKTVITFSQKVHTLQLYDVHVDEEQKVSLKMPLLNMQHPLGDLTSLKTY